MKAPYVSYSQTPEAIDYMRRVKKIFDPKGIMNPYKYGTLPHAFLLSELMPLFADILCPKIRTQI